MAHRQIALALAVPAAVAAFAALPAAAASADTGTFSASAVGTNEPGGGATDASAQGTFRIDTAAGQVCYSVSAKGLADAAAMHIHQGAAGVNGPVVIPLDPAKVGAGESCTTAQAALLDAVIADPAGYYLNVHTPAFPAGAVRDQLSAAAPGSVNAGSGGQAADGVPVAPLALMTAGVAVIGAAGWRLARR